VWATVSSQVASRRVGAWMTSDNPPSPPRPNAPNAEPAPSPHTVSGATAGTAARFDGMAATGTPPNAATRSGATPAWAARVTDSGSVTNGGPGSRAASRSLRRTMPAHALTESRNPRACTSNGSSSTSAVTARARCRTGGAGRPAHRPAAAIAAIAVARSTDGSKRVTNAKPTSTPMVRPNRAGRPTRRSAGLAATSTKATFWPETTSRWLRPAARKSSLTSSDCRRSSPTITPSTRARSSGRRPASPASRVRRSRFAKENGSVDPPTRITRDTASRPTTWRAAR